MRLSIRRPGSRGFACESEDRSPCAGAHTEAKRLKVIQNRGDGGKEAGALCLKEDTQCPRQAKAEIQGHSTGDSIIQHDDRLPSLKPEAQHFSLTWADLGDEALGEAPRRHADLDPVESGRIRQVDAMAATHGNFGCHRKRDEDATRQRG